jgi:hypothetical protein
VAKTTHSSRIASLHQRRVGCADVHFTINAAGIVTVTALASLMHAQSGVLDRCVVPLSSFSFSLLFLHPVYACIAWIHPLLARYHATLLFYTLPQQRKAISCMVFYQNHQKPYQYILMIPCCVSSESVCPHDVSRVSALLSAAE